MNGMPHGLVLGLLLFLILLMTFCLFSQFLLMFADDFKLFQWFRMMMMYAYTL